MNTSHLQVSYVSYHRSKIKYLALEVETVDGVSPTGHAYQAANNCSRPLAVYPAAFQLPNVGVLWQPIAVHEKWLLPGGIVSLKAGI